jgi:hypothetical protein
MHSVHNESCCLIVLVTGKVDQQTLYDAQRDLMLHPEYSHKNSFWIFDEGCECDLSNVVLFEMVRRIKAFFPPDGTKKKAAMIAADSTIYSRIKTFCNAAEYEGIPFTIKSFKKLQDAAAWLMCYST